MSREQPISASKGQATRAGTLLGWEISRRQFVVVVGGSAAAVAVAAGYGLAATDLTPAKNSFWTVRVVRAGRGGRMTAQGLPAFHEAPGPSFFSSHVQRAAASRPANSARPGASIGSLSGHTEGHSGGHTDGGSLAASYPQPLNRTWGDVVVLELKVLNTATVPSLFSPGQLRLKLADGPTVTPQDASRGPAPIAAGATELLWVRYLTPSDVADFSVEFTDPLHDAQLALAMPGLVTSEAQS